MNKVKNLAATLILALAMAVSASADGIMGGDRPPPPPPTAPFTSVISPVEPTAEAESITPTYEIALTILESLLALF